MSDRGDPTAERPENTDDGDGPEYSPPDMETLGSLAAIGSLFISEKDDDMGATPGYGWHDDGGYDDDHDWCFITTATAGERELGELRRFRDEVLADSLIGRALLGVYYTISPPVAGTLHRNPESTTARAVRSLVEACSRLAKTRKQHSGPVATLVSVSLTVLYMIGVGIAVLGHTAIRVSAGLTARRENE